MPTGHTEPLTGDDLLLCDLFLPRELTIDESIAGRLYLMGTLPHRPLRVAQLAQIHLLSEKGTHTFARRVIASYHATRHIPLETLEKLEKGELQV